MISLPDYWPLITLSRLGGSALTDSPSGGVTHTCTRRVLPSNAGPTLIVRCRSRVSDATTASSVTRCSKSRDNDEQRPMLARSGLLGADNLRRVEWSSACSRRSRGGAHVRALAVWQMRLKSSTSKGRGVSVSEPSSDHLSVTEVRPPASGLRLPTHLSLMRVTGSRTSCMGSLSRMEKRTDASFWLRMAGLLATTSLSATGPPGGSRAGTGTIGSKPAEATAISQQVACTQALSSADRSIQSSTST